MSLNGLLKAVIPNLPLVAEDKAVETLRMLPPETLFLALKEADTENALWVFENTKADQIQGVMDLDCWKGDQFLPERFFRYFEYITYTTPEKLREYMRDLDPEIITLALMDILEVTDFDPQNPPEIDERRFLLSPDNKYALILKTPDLDLRERVFQWLNKFSSVDIDLMRRHLESLKWENKNDTEEFAYQIKKGRIEELGFVEREEAIRFYSKVSAQTLKKHLLDHPLEKDAKEDTPLIEVLGNDDFLPQPISKAIKEEGFFKKALSHIESHQLVEVIRMEVVRTINAVFAAEDIFNEDLDVLREYAGRTRSYLDLGLLYLSAGDENRASDILQEQPVFEVARLGWVLVQDLVNASAEIKKTYPLNFFGSSERELLRSLDGRHPRIEHPDVLRDLALESFQYFTLEALHKVADQVGSLSLLGNFFQESIGASLLIKDEPIEVAESMWARLSTALFRQASGREFSAKALKLSEWNELKATWDLAKAEKILDLIGAKVPESARKHFEKRMKEYLSDINQYAKNAQDINPRFAHALRWNEA